MATLLPDGPAKTKNTESSGAIAMEAWVPTLSSCSSRPELYQKALKIIGQHFDAPYAITHVDTRSGTVEEEYQFDNQPNQSWKKLCQALLLKAQCNRVAQARSLRSSLGGHRFVAMSVPVVQGAEGVVGAFAVVLPCDNKKIAESRLTEFQAIGSLIGMLAANVGNGLPKNSAKSKSLHGIAKAASYGSLREFAFAIVNNLKGKLGCEQVCLGLVRRHRVQLLCMSGFDDLYPRSPGARQIEQAMEECHDAQQTICYQDETQWSEGSLSTGHHLHRNWHDQTGNSAVASIPLMIGDDCIAVLSIRNPSEGQFASQQLAKIQELVSPIAAGIQLLSKADRSWWRHSREAVSKTTAQILARGAWGRKFAALLFLSACLWLIFGKCEYVISVPCDIAPSEIRQIAAPFDGRIASVHVESGDRVTAGQLLIRLNIREFESDQRQLMAEKMIAELDLAAATTNKNLVMAAQATANVKRINCQLELLKYQMNQAEVRAPADGRILLADLGERVGGPVVLGEPLIEFAENADWSANLYVPEFAAAYLEVGQVGEFSTYARPDSSSKIIVKRVHSSSEVVDGKNVLRIEAEICDQPPDWVVSGMQGFSRVETGKRPIWWVWLHRPIDTVRVAIWKM